MVSLVTWKWGSTRTSVNYAQVLRCCEQAHYVLFARGLLLGGLAWLSMSSGPFETLNSLGRPLHGVARAWSVTIDWCAILLESEHSSHSQRAGMQCGQRATATGQHADTSRDVVSFRGRYAQGYWPKITWFFPQSRNKVLCMTSSSLRRQGKDSQTLGPAKCWCRCVLLWAPQTWERCRHVAIAVTCRRDAHPWQKFRCPTCRKTCADAKLGSTTIICGWF